MLLPAFDQLGSFVYRRRWLILAGWLVGLVALGAASALGGGKFATRFTIPGSESQAANDLLRERFPARSGGTAELVFHLPGDGPTADDAAVRARIEGVVDSARRLPEVTSVDSPYEQTFAIAGDRRTAFATVQYQKDAQELSSGSADALIDLIEASTAPDLVVEAGGEVVISTEQEPPGQSELIGIAAAAVILVIAFGSLVAMGLPILAAVISLGASVSLIALFAHFLDMTDFTPAFAAMIGLGVGIDYALLVITRFRESLHSGQSVHAATITAVSTAGRSVLFAGTIVMIAMLGLLLIGIPFLAALGVAAATVVGISVLAAITLLPAALGVVGHRVDSLGIPMFQSREVGHETTTWYRFSHMIQNRPAVFAGGAVALLLVAALPVLRMERNFTDAGNNPPDTHSRRAYDLLSNGFGAGFNGPLVVVVDSSRRGKETIPALRDAVAAVPGVQRLGEVKTNTAGDTASFTVYPSTSPQDSATNKLVAQLRSQTIPGVVAGTGLATYITGATALTIDVSDRVNERTPLFFAMVIGLSFVVLMCVFRSVLIPLTAALMNMLSIGAALGVLVAVFQWGWLAGPLGINQTGPIESFVPMMMFAILFGLSMDYEVFLVTRIKEEHTAGRRNREAVAYGLSTTARVISSAALIMIAVFGSFILGDERIIKEFGLGLAVAIFFDATLVRLILVPAIMELLGESNWWLPRRLDRILPKIHVERPAHEPQLQPSVE